MSALQNAAVFVTTSFSIAFGRCRGHAHADGATPIVTDNEAKSYREC